MINGYFTSIATVVVSVLLSAAAALYSQGYQAATVNALVTKVNSLSDVVPLISSLETHLKDIDRRIGRLEDKLDDALKKN